MQFSLAFLFLLTTYGAAAEDACPPTEVVKFAELYANPHLHPCQKASAGFSLVPPTGYPTEPQVKAMCVSDACRALIKDVLDLKPADCYLSFSGAKVNAHKMACSFQDACDAHMNEDHEEKTHQPAPKSTDGKHHPTPKPTEDDKHYPAPKHTDNKHYPAPKPTEENYHPTPKPTDDKYYPTPKPTEDGKHYPSPKPSDDKHYSTLKPTYDTPKPTEYNKHYPTPKPTDHKYTPNPKPEDDKHYSTPKPTEDKYHTTPKPTDKYRPTPKPTDDDKYHDKLEEPKIVKIENVDKLNLTARSIGKEADKDADKLKPPMNGTAFELFPMPNTTYKATHAPKTD